MFFLKLHSPHGRQSVVDIIERIQIDMQFVIPVTTAVHEFVILICPPWHIFFFQFMPFVCALLRRQFRMRITDMLEFIHSDTKRHKGQCLLQMSKTELICIFSKEPLCIRIGKLLHRHGMDLCYVCGRKIIFLHRLDP